MNRKFLAFLNQEAEGRAWWALFIDPGNSCKKERMEAHSPAGCLPYCRITGLPAAGDPSETQKEPSRKRLSREHMWTQRLDLLAILEDSGVGIPEQNILFLDNLSYNFIIKQFFFLPSWMAQYVRICLQCRKHRRCRSDPWVRKVPLEEEDGYPFQYSCLENPMGR